MKKHNNESYADWAKEHRIKGWERIYDMYHPIEADKRRQQGVRFWHNSQRKKDQKKYK
mgnify:CR=1 FL=1